MSDAAADGTSGRRSLSGGGASLRIDEIRSASLAP